MLLSLTLENFRGKTAQYPLGKVTHLHGTNEVGKSTIREAVAFAFTGCDSAGNRAPVHLISWGQESCTVKVQTEKAVIQRTLTRKKNGSLRLLRGELASVLSQTQLEELLGSSSDLFLSVFVPGFFWQLPLAKQQSVLSEVLPPFDTEYFIESQLQSSLTEEEHVKFGILKKRPDLVALAAANERRDVQRRMDVNAGRLAALQAVTAIPPRPATPPELAMLEALVPLKKAWNEYRVQVSAHRQAVATRNNLETTNAGRRARKAEIQEQLKTLPPLMQEPTFSEAKRAEISSLRSQVQSKPQSPRLVQTVDADNCPACGQVVGAKHKEKVRAENNKRLLECEEETKKIEVHNAEIQKRIAGLLEEETRCRDELRKTQSHNDGVRRSKAQLEGELAGLEDIPLPFLPAVPSEPHQPYNESDESKLRSVVEHYQRQCAEHEYAQKQLDAKSQEVARIHAEDEPLRLAHSRLQAIEEALRVLPEAKLKKQAEDLSMDGFQLETGDATISLRRTSDNCPRELLSSGAQLRADIAFALKLNSLMRRPIGVMFIDNRELVADPMELPLQVFSAVVKAGDATLRVIAQEGGLF